MAKIKEKFNHIPKIKRELNKMDNLAVQIGIPADEEKLVIVRANVHEYGSEVHTENAFIRSTYDSIEDKIIRKFKDGVFEIMKGNKDAEEVFDEVGKFIRDKIKAEITKKGLVDTGKMRDAIDYMVVKI